MSLSFTKMHGAGNDFIMMDNRDGQIRLNTNQIALLCDRHRGIGADGLILVEPGSEKANFRMRYYNSDGREAEMCGNGARCFARYVQRLSVTPAEKISFETPAGIIRSVVLGDKVELQMSDPTDYCPPTTLQLKEGPQEVCFINTGVPHAVLFVDKMENIDIDRRGAELRFHDRFAPHGTNVNFVQILSPDHLRIRTYERGVDGETLACGTGIVASALLYHLRSASPSPIRVTVQGEDTLQVSFDNAPNFQNVRMLGPAQFVFDGQIEISNL